MEKYNLPNLIGEETENMNRPITSMQIEIVINNLSTNKSPRPDGFTGKFYQKFREYLSCSNSSRKLQRKENSQINEILIQIHMKSFRPII